MPALLDEIFQAEFHVVAQVVESELVVRAVCDIRHVRRAPLLIVEIMNDDAYRKTQELVKPAHPLGVAACQVVVDGNDVNTFTGECVEIDRERCDKSLTFTGPHLSDLAPMQHNA